jgi:NTE family protein
VTVKPVNLALQGGGSHGAFTWGVLDRLLDDGRIGIEALSGTSAGAMNAVVLADGFVRNGVEGAREALADFWHEVSWIASKSPIQRNPVNVLLGDWGLENSPSYLFFDLLGRLASPYELNPLNIDPLRELLEKHVDFDRIHHCERIKLFVSATNVHTGRVRVFTARDVTADAVLASACLPYMFHAVEIDGVPYWDGGYMGNPVLFPFFNHCASSDILIVQINPVERKQTPKTAREILDRVNEITFNSSLLKEFRAIEFVGRLIRQGKLDATEYKDIRLHSIQGGESMLALSASSKLNAEWRFVQFLYELGWQQADRWLEEHWDELGVRSSYDIKELFDIGPHDDPESGVSS